MTCEDQDLSGQVLTCILWAKFVPFTNKLEQGSGGEQSYRKAEKCLAVPGRAIPQKVWREQSRVECKFLFLTIQYHTENTSIFKNCFIEGTQGISDGKSVCKCLQPFNLTLSPFNLNFQVLLHLHVALRKKPSIYRLLFCLKSNPLYFLFYCSYSEKRSFGAFWKCWHQSPSKISKVRACYTALGTPANISLIKLLYPPLKLWVVFLTPIDIGGR